VTEPVRQNLTAVRGDTKTWTLTFSQDISAFAEIWLTIRDGYDSTAVDDEDAISQLKLSAGGITPTGARTADAEFDNEDTTAWLTTMSLVYDVQVRTTTGKIYTTQLGQIRISHDVTRSTAAP
jgi:hypothetical protein